MRNMQTRRSAAREVREEAARLAFRRPHSDHPANGEEDAYRNEANQLSYIANYSKGLPHNDDGEVVPLAYRTLRRALDSRDPRDFRAIHLSELDAGECPQQNLRHRRLINPQAGVAFDLEGPDSHSLRVPPPPRINSARASSEMAELYWMSVVRDVPFANYHSDQKISQAATDLTAFTDFGGPSEGGQVTPATLFRGRRPGDRVGPYVSQFLIKDVPYGPYNLVQRKRTAQAETDFMLEWAEWKCIQDGAEPDRKLPLTKDTFYMRNLRDLTAHVHIDASYQHYLNACLIIQQMDLPPTTLSGLDAPPCMSGPLDPGNPYFPPGPFPPAPPLREEGLVTFGNWHIQTLLAEVTTRALKAAWYQKWFVHRRLRPEALGGLIEAIRSRNKRYPVDDEIRASLGDHDRLGRYFGPGHQFDTLLLPQAFLEGSPMHPSYPEGHATLAGACVTILKAWFDASYEFDATSENPRERPEVPTADGTKLKPYHAPAGERPLTVGGELEKLASNIGLGGRCGAGVHSRSDHQASLALGEAVAIGLLEEQALTYNEPHSFTLTKFNGQAVTIGSGS